MDSTSDRVLIDWKTWPMHSVEVHAVQTESGADGWLSLRTTKGDGAAGITLLAPAGNWDLTKYAEVSVQVRNAGTEPVRVALRLDDATSRNIPDTEHERGMAAVTLQPKGPSVWLGVPLGDREAIEVERKLISMRSLPSAMHGRGTVDSAVLTSVRIFVTTPQADRSIVIGPVIARGAAPERAKIVWDRFFPFIDEFGQFKHLEWPGKTHSEQDMAAVRKREVADLRSNARPSEWNRYGGWARGPQREATGFFRTERIDGWWWMVDPEGRLFWSHGVVRVGTRIRVGGVYRGTPIQDRESYFNLPPKDSPLGQFYGTEPQSTRGYYVGKHDHAVYDYLEANLFRKYGADWSAQYASATQQRLGSWGLNTIANSSDPAVYSLRRMPYTAIVYSAPLGGTEHRIEGTSGNWGKMPDPFDPGFRETIEKTLKSDLKDSLGDPWCLGFFVDNELHWGDSCYMASATLASPARQPAKRAMLERLTKQYGDIGRLNKAWATQHASWEALLASTVAPAKERAAVRRDLEAFSSEIVETYFRVCRDSVKAASPNHLYLGCRFAGSPNPAVTKIAAEYCDVVSINQYSRTIDDLKLPDGLDRPIVIGEFHFGACDRGLFGPPALVTVPTQAARADAYCAYVESALRNPAVVGTHWFQFYDQPTSGRFDGENYQAGLLDICDTPYRETVEACRQMGAVMYRTRAEARTDGTTCESWPAIQAAGPDLPLLGRLKTRHAREIESSPWSIGCETLDRDFTIYDNYKDYVGPLGAKAARIQSGWAKCEKVKGRYDWAWLDHVIDDLNAQGVRPWVCICYGNPAYEGGGTAMLNGGFPTSTEAIEAWKRYVQTMVKRYQGRVLAWEVWNEPDFRRDAAQVKAYTELYIRTAEIIRAIDPKEQLWAVAACSPESSFIPDFLENMKTEGKLGLIDEITYHGYTFRPEDQYRHVDGLSAAVNRFDKRIGIRQGENGAPSIRHRIHALSRFPWTEFSQAKWYLRRMLNDRRRGLWSSVFSIVDIRYDEVLLSMGLLRADDQKRVLYRKPAYYAAQHTISIFDDSVKPVGPIPFRVPDGEKASVAAFKKADADLILIWRDGAVPTDDLQWKPLDVAIEKVTFKDPVYIDLLSGKVYKVGKERWRSSGGGTVFTALPVWDSPMLIAERAQMRFE